jgi:hypothetical protein
MTEYVDQARYEAAHDQISASEDAYFNTLFERYESRQRAAFCDDCGEEFERGDFERRLCCVCIDN